MGTRELRQGRHHLTAWCSTTSVSGAGGKRLRHGERRQSEKAVALAVLHSKTFAEADITKSLSQVALGGIVAKVAASLRKLRFVINEISYAHRHT